MNFFEITKLNSWNAFKDVLFQRKKIWLYGMQYWYFKLIDSNGKRVFSYILAKNRIDTSINNKRYYLEENEYLQVETDFFSQNQKITVVEPSWAKNILNTPSFSFTLEKDGLSLTFQKKQFYFNDVQADSYQANVFNIYQSLSLNTGNGRYYVTIQNIVKQGPLVPWHWLHLHLKDGTYVSLFLIMGTFNRVFWLGDQKWHLNGVDYKNNRVIYKASKQNMFFYIELKKQYITNLVYQPKFSPSWFYSQIEVSVEAVTTNVLELQEMDSGVGILELAKGICW